MDKLGDSGPPSGVVWSITLLTGVLPSGAKVAESRTTKLEIKAFSSKFIRNLRIEQTL